MPLNVFYTTVQKSQKWPKTQNKGGGPTLREVRCITKQNWAVAREERPGVMSCNQFWDNIRTLFSLVGWNLDTREK